jgi:DNA-binding CsgD family transcriptional regulator
MSPAGATSGPELVGRSDELRTLAEARRRAAQGRGGFVLVAGEAGIGKSRLVATLNGSLKHGRALHATGLGREFGCTPYGPVSEALRSIGADVPSPGARDRAEHLSRLFEALAAVCRRRFVSIVFEDLQWADDGTLKFLAHALPWVASLRLLIVATYRSEDTNAGSPLASHVARFARDPACMRVELGPLGRAELRRLLVQAQPPGRRLPRAVLEEIARRSEGNPFFAQELLRAALERRERAASAGDLPTTIAAIVGERLAVLSPESRRLVTLASVIGRRFEATFLAELAAAPFDDVLEALRTARDARLVDELPDGVYAFRHALTRESVYAGMLLAQARPLHARILRALERKEGADVHDLSYHAWAAGEASDCVRYGERAGDDADAVHAYADAVRCYERATSGTLSSDARGRLYAKAAASAARDGDAPCAAEFYEAAAHEAERSHDTVRAMEHYRAMSSQARLGGDNERAMVILERARILLGESDEPEAHARLGLALAVLYLDRGDAVRANAMLERCFALDGSFDYHNARGYAALVAGDVAGIREAAEACAALGGDRVAAAQFNLAYSLGVVGHDAEALACFDAILPELGERRLSSLEVLACANRAMILARRGRPAEARDAIERGLEIPEPATTGPVALASAALVAGRLLGDDEIVERCVTPEVVEAAFASRINSTLGRFAGPYARWLEARGARAEVSDVLERATMLIAAPFAATDTLVAAVQLGNAATRERALAFLPAIEAMSELDIYRATAAHMRALEAHAENDAARASRLARGAAECYSALGWPSHQAQCEELAGKIDDAAVLLERIGAPGELQRIRRVSALRTAHSPLSVREREIAALIANGTPNRVLAERFGINQRTIEKHLTSIYTKLGLRNRSELAAFIARHAP